MWVRVKSKGERRGEGGEEAPERHAPRNASWRLYYLFQDLPRSGGVSGLVKQWESADSTVEDIWEVSSIEAWGRDMADLYRKCDNRAKKRLSTIFLSVPGIDKPCGIVILQFS